MTLRTDLYLLFHKRTTHMGHDEYTTNFDQTIRTQHQNKTKTEPKQNENKRINELTDAQTDGWTDGRMDE